MNNSYLIPANSKKSLLYFNLFNKFDLILFGSGVGVSLVLLLILSGSNLGWTIFALAPGLITGFLVLPIPNYHNILTVILNVIDFYTTRQRYIWKGWCFLDGKESKK